MTAAYEDVAALAEETGQPPRRKSYTLYRFWDANDVLLYVGITGDPRGRWGAHGRDKPWWGDVARVTVEHFKSSSELEAAEIAAIRAEKPKYNVLHTKPERPARRAGARTNGARASQRRECRFEPRPDSALPNRLKRVLDAWAQGVVPTRESWDFLPNDTFLTDGGGFARPVHHSKIHDVLMALGGPADIEWRVAEIGRGHDGINDGALFDILDFPSQATVDAVADCGCPDCSDWLSHLARTSYTGNVPGASQVTGGCCVRTG